MVRHKPLTSILIKPSGPDCNLRCAYCFYTGKTSLFGGHATHRMDSAILEATIRQVMEESREQVAISWQGGEPTLMGLPFFEDAIRLEQKYGEGKIVGNGLQTNGVLVDDRWASFLRTNEFLVGLSIDGPEHIHDNYRRFANGSASWSMVMRGAECMHKHGVAVNSVSTVTRYSADYADEVYDFLKDAGFNYMQFIPVVEASEDPNRLAEYSVTPEQYGNFLIRLFDRWLADFGTTGPTTFIRFFDAVFARYAGLEPTECEFSATCGTYVVVEHNGDVYSCDFFVEPEWRLGSVKQGSLIGLLNSPKQHTFGEVKAHLPVRCAACPWRSYCRGGCPKDRLRYPEGGGTTYFCESFTRFLEHADLDFKKLARHWKERSGEPAV